MLPDIKSFPVNWVDGMKISSQDFISLENALSEGIRDARSLHVNEFSYGLLPTNHPEVDNYPKLVFDYAKSQLVLKECRALTPGGHRVEVTEANFERRKYPAQLPSVTVATQEPGRYDVYLLLDPLERVGAGEFAENNPPRYRSVSPKYELSVRVHDGQPIEQESFLKISEIEVREGRVDVRSSSGRYIPPCTSLQAHSSLRREHAGGEERLKALLQHYLNLCHRMGGETKNESAQEAIQLAEKIVAPVVSTLSYYRYLLPQRPPLFLVVYVKDYARTVRFLLEKSFRGEVINRYKKNLVELIAEVEKTEPRHAAIRPSLEKGQNFLNELERFLAELSKHSFEIRSFDITDFNRLGSYPEPARPTPEPVRPEPVVVRPPEPTVVRQF
ncbi:hypothetical protein BH24BAC1_BH24BAC1_37050 [soil metagenome]